MTNIVFIGLHFFKSISQSWISYYNQSSGPKFTEEPIQMGENTAGT